MTFDIEGAQGTSAVLPQDVQHFIRDAVIIESQGDQVVELGHSLVLLYTGRWRLMKSSIFILDTKLLFVKQLREVRSSQPSSKVTLAPFNQAVCSLFSGSS